MSWFEENKYNNMHGAKVKILTDVLELVTAKKMPHNDDPITYLKWVVAGIRFKGIQLKNSITLVQSSCARFGIPYTSVLLSLCNPYNWSSHKINPLNPELNPICYLLALLEAHHFLHVSRIRVKLLTLRRLMSYTYIYGAPILDVSRSHTTTQHSR